MAEMEFHSYQTFFEYETFRPGVPCMPLSSNLCIQKLSVLHTHEEVEAGARQDSGDFGRLREGQRKAETTTRSFLRPA